MEYNTIKIYIASNNDEVTSDKLELSNLVRRLNDIYKPIGTRIKILETDKLYSDDDKLYDIKSKISQSNLFISLTYEQIDDLTVKEIGLAAGEYSNESQSKIYPYIKHSLVEREELTKFKDYLLKELSINWSDYTNNDTLKLHFVMQIQSIENSIPIKLKVESSIVKLGDESIADLNCVPFAANNERLASLKEQYVSLNSELQLLNSALVAKENVQVRELYWEKCKARTSVKEMLEGLEESLFNTALFITNLRCVTSSDRLRRAIAKFDSGDDKGANKILDSKLIDTDIQLAIAMVEEGKKSIAEIQTNVRVNIKEYLLKVNTTLTDFDNENRFNEACLYHKLAIEAAKKCELPTQEIIDSQNNYANFLAIHKQFSKAIEIYRINLPLLLSQSNPNADVLSDIAMLKANIGVNYFCARDITSALNITLESLELCNKLRDEKLKSEDYLNTHYSIIHNSLGLIYLDLGDCENSEFNHLKALSYRQKVANAENNIFALNPVAQSMDNLGLLYYGQKRYEEAEKMYLEAYAIYEEIYTKGGQKIFSIIINQDSLGRLYVKQEKYYKAQEAYFTALGYAEDLYNEFPERYKPELARVQRHLGEMMMMLGYVDLAKEQLFASLNHYFQMSKQEIKPYEQTVRSILTFLNENLAKYNRASEAEEITLSILQQLSNDDKYKRLRKIVYTSLGFIYINSKEFEKAEDIFISLINDSKEASESLSLINLINIGSLYINIENYTKAEEYLMYAVNQISSNNNDVGDDYEAANNYEIACIMYNLGYLYLKTNKLDNAIAYMQDSKEIFNNLREDEPFMYDQLYAKNLMYLGESYLQKKDGEQAVYLMSESLCLFLDLPDSLHFAHKDFIISLIERLNTMLSCSENQAELDDYISKGKDLIFDVKDVDDEDHNLSIPEYFAMAARALHNVCIHYYKISNYERLQYLGQETVDIYSRLYMLDKSKYLQYLRTVIEITCIAYEFSNKHKLSEALHELEVSILSDQLNIAGIDKVLVLSDLLAAQNDLACCYANLNKFEQAIEINEENLEIYKELAEDNYSKYLVGIVRCERNLASFYSKVYNFDRSELFYLNVIERYKELVEIDPDVYNILMADAHYLIAKVYIELNDGKSVEKHLLSSIEIRSKIGVDVNLAACEGALGSLYMEIENPVEALKYFNLSLEHYIEINDGITHNNIIESLNKKIEFISIQLESRSEVASSNKEYLEKLYKMVSNEEYTYIINLISNKENLYAEEKFFLALSLLRLDMPSKAIDIFIELNSDNSNSIGLRFASLTNTLVSLLLLKQFDKYIETYNKLSDEDKEDDDIKEIHKSYKDIIVTKPNRSFKDYLLFTNKKEIYQVEIKKPYGYMF